MTPQENSEPLSAHVEALRSSVLSSLVSFFFLFSLAWVFADRLIAYLAMPLMAHKAALHLFSPLEAFFCSLKVSFVAAALLSSPLMTWQFMRFLFPGLYPHERAFCRNIALIMLSALIGGLFLSIQFVIPLLLSALFLWSAPYGENLWGLSSYIDFVLLMIFSTVVLVFLLIGLIWSVYTGLFPHEILVKRRKEACLISFILGALLTPPDIFSQLLVAIPLYGAFEIALLCSRPSK